MAHALRHFRVVLLDQRGTGRSTRSASPSTYGATPQEQADSLALFRADAIVADAELLRAHLGVERWSVLGQSFGGFCLLHYLSVAPGSLPRATSRRAAAGRPPVDDVYAATYPTVLERNRLFHERYPADRDRVRRVHDLAAEGRIVLPGGDRLTPPASATPAACSACPTARRRCTTCSSSTRSPAPSATTWPTSCRGAVATRSTRCSRSLLRRRHHDGLGRGAHPARGVPRRPHALRRRARIPRDPRRRLELAPLTGAADLLAHRAWPRLYDADALGEVDVPCAGRGLRP